MRTGAQKEHGRAVRAGGRTGAATDAGGRVHGGFGHVLRHQNGVGVTRRTGLIL